MFGENELATEGSPLFGQMEREVPSTAAGETVPLVIAYVAKAPQNVHF